MTSACIFFLLTCLQLLTGFGVLSLFRLWLKPGLFLPLAMMTGIGIFSVVPFLLELLHLRLSAFHVFAALALVCLLVNLRIRSGIVHLPAILPKKKIRLAPYDIPYLIVILAIVLISVWRCFYLPPFPRDLTSGAEVIAAYAVKEKSMLNSVFLLDLDTTNNPFKPPFITCLQIIYKYAGFPFGQVWLSVLFISFLLFLYHALCLRLHRLIAGLLLVFFLAIPEMYAYTFMALFDYSNAVYFFLAVYFLVSYFSLGQKSHLAFAAWMMALATYTRPETLVLACLLMLPLLWHHFKKGDSLLKMAARTFVFLAPSFLCYVLTVTIYLGHYLPVTYDVGDQVNRHLLHLGLLVDRFVDMNKELIFSESGVSYYGYFIFIFLVVLIFDLVLSDYRTRRSKNWLIAVLAVYLGLAFLGYLLPLLDLDHSTKRGLFKIFPLMLLYLGSSSLLTRLSASIKKWERS